MAFNTLSDFSVDGVMQSSAQGVLVGTVDTMPDASAAKGATVLYVGSEPGYASGTFYTSDGTSWSVSEVSQGIADGMASLEASVSSLEGRSVLVLTVAGLDDAVDTLNLRYADGTRESIPVSGGTATVEIQAIAGTLEIEAVGTDDTARYVQTASLEILTVDATMSSLVTDAAVATLELGESVTGTLYESGLLSVTGEGAMYDFESTASPTYAYASSIVTVEIAEGVTTVGAYAFEWCMAMTSASIPEGVTSIGAGAFHRCTSLAGIVLPSTLETIYGSAFWACYALEYADLSACASLTTMEGNSFANCTSLKSIDLSATRLTQIRATFNGCTVLESIAVPATVTYITWGYTDCPALMRMDIAEGNTVYCSVDGIAYNKAMTALYLFPAGRSETEFAVPDTVTSIGNYAFYQCANLESVTLPAVTAINTQAFYGCTSLRTVLIPELTAIPTLGTNAWSDTPIYPDYDSDNPGYIYVDDDYADEVKEATNWTVYADHILAYSERTEGE